MARHGETETRRLRRGAPARSAWLSACRGPWRLVRLLLSFCANCTAFTVAPVPLCFFAFFAMREGGWGAQSGKDLLFPLRWTSRPFTESQRPQSDTQTALSLTQQASRSPLSLSCSSKSLFSLHRLQRANHYMYCMKPSFCS